MDTKTLLNTFGLEPHNTPSTLAKIGMSFNRLTILTIGRKIGTYRYVAICSCSCGTPQIAVRLDKITSNHTQSCGCFHAESITTHGLHSHQLYDVWKNLMSRCYQPTNKRYSRYGGRGITVCERWHNINNFVDDMYASYTPNYQIDRINNDLGYSPDNCRWATHSEQQRNRSNNIHITINDETKVLSEWCRVFGVPYRRTYERITYQHWEPLKALTQCALK